MMGQLKSEQTQLFYQFKLDDAVPDDHLVRKIDAALDRPGFAANLHRTIRRWVVRRSIQN